MKYKSIVILFVFVLSLVAFSWTQDRTTASGPVIPTISLEEIKQFRAQEAMRTDDNLLSNGDMNIGFYWRPTNHFVAFDWFEWWGNYLTIPEFLDGGHPHHNQCYPEPAPGQLCNDLGNHSQGYIRMGLPYNAGAYQPVSGVTPCTPYTFEVYNRNDLGVYHPKVGIDVSGWVITRLGNSKPDNCPPDGVSRCPDPYIAEFPATMVWSAESTHPGYTWAPIRITAEPINTTLSVWTYVRSEVDGSQSTYWDYASLVQGSFPDGKLPAPSSWTPSGFIQNLTVEWLLNKVRIRWATPTPASTQVWYTFTPGSDNNYDKASTLNTTPTTSHEVIIGGLKNAGDTLRFAALSRRPLSTACTTEVATQTFVVPDRTPTPASWAVSPMITNLSTTVVQNGIHVTWDTSISATTQVWYTIIPAPTPPHTSTMVLGNLIYLPFMTRTSYNYTQYTHLSLTLRTHHDAFIAYIPQEGEHIDFVALSGYTPNNVVTILPSAQRRIGPFQTQLVTPSALPARLKQ